MTIPSVFPMDDLPERPRCPVTIIWRRADGSEWAPDCAYDMASQIDLAVINRNLRDGYSIISHLGVCEVTHTIQDTIKLARAFGERVQAELTVGQFRSAVDRNKASDDDLVCHTHDFCDANMLMYAAFADAFGRDPALGTDQVIEDDDLALWNDAWAVAVAADFFA